MFAIVLAALSAALVSPSPLQYYSQALATMERLPEPADVAFQTNVTGHGMGEADPCERGKMNWDFGWGAKMHDQLSWHAVYSSANANETIRTARGDVCSGPAETFDRPVWSDVYDWIRYGAFSDSVSTATRPQAASKSTPALKTIADVSVIAPGAYWVQDGGAQACPSGSPGHALHFVPRFDAPKHPLRDAVVETQSMRICMIRFDLGEYQAAGTGFRSDMRLDFGDVGGNWIVTRGHAVLAARMAGISLKSATFDFWYSDVTFPKGMAGTN